MSNKGSCDRLGWSQKLLIILFAVTIVFVTFPIMDSHFRFPDEGNLQAIRALKLTNLSVMGSGRPLRHPGAVVSSVNLYFSPFLTRLNIEPEYLILNPLSNTKEHVAP